MRIRPFLSSIQLTDGPNLRLDLVFAAKGSVALDLPVQPDETGYLDMKEVGECLIALGYGVCQLEAKLEIARLEAHTAMEAPPPSPAQAAKADA